jgi:hypothetical protein
MKRTLSLGLAGAALAALALAATHKYTPAVPAAAATTPDAAAAPAPVAAITADAAASAPAARETAATAPQVTFPDGTTRPALNGVDEPTQLQWPPDRPYAPVVATVRDGEVEWWKHADGSWSTTLRRYDTASGRWLTLTPLFQPAEVKPTQLRGH